MISELAWSGGRRNAALPALGIDSEGRREVYFRAQEEVENGTPARPGLAGGEARESAPGRTRDERCREVDALLTALLMREVSAMLGILYRPWT